DLASAGSFFIRVLVVTLAAIVLLALPGWRTTLVGSKPVYVRFLELILFYVMVGAIGLAFELSLSNPFPKTWEFYVITASLYLVLGYPGFVYRYLYRHRGRRK